MINTHYVLAALAFNFLGTGFYITKSLHRKVQPHLVTFGIWAFAPLVGFAAQTAMHVGPPALVTLVVGVNPLLILLFALRSPDAHWKLTRFDLACGALALLGLGLWACLRNATYAILLSIASDFMASLPTYRKSLSNPESESSVLYIFLTISATITLLTIKDWSLANYAFSAYLATLGASLSVIILLGRVRGRGLLHP
ncbi:hypothetical protein ACFY0F_30545 [Streptomyces sp. NPDC001544]|uniref:hypothetical protein n=1 Tax=Streptomyces sp. NPDC001544 TaxID=3364584 RepID=UPI00368ED786